MCSEENPGLCMQGILILTGKSNNKIEIVFLKHSKRKNKNPACSTSHYKSSLWLDETTCYNWVDKAIKTCLAKLDMAY